MGLGNAALHFFVLLGKLRAGHHFREEALSGLNLAALALCGNHTEQFTHLAIGFKMVAAVAQLVYHRYQAPALQFLDAVADIGTRHAQGFTNFIRRHRTRRNEQ